MAALAAIHPLDLLYAGYLIANFFCILIFSGWFIIRLDRIIAENGDLDLYLNYTFRLFAFTFGLYLVWAVMDAIIASFGP